MIKSVKSTERMTQIKKEQECDSIAEESQEVSDNIRFLKWVINLAFKYRLYNA